MNLLIILFIVNTVAAKQLHYVWPELITNLDNSFFVGLFCFDSPNGCDISDSYCGTEPSAANIIETYNLTSETGFYQLVRLGFDHSSCSRTARNIAFKVDDISYRLHIKKQDQVVPGVYMSSVRSSICPSKGSFAYWTVPCTTVGNPFCHTAIVCEGDLKMKRPQTYTVDSNGLQKAHNENRECNIIFIEEKEFSCSKTSGHLTADEVTFHGKICSLNKGEILGDKLVLEVPARIGMHVCIDYRSKKNKPNSQQCTVSKSDIVEFSVPSDTHAVQLTCDGEIQRAFTKEEKEFSCPMIFLDTAFAKAICQDSYRPVLFWVSILWLIFGLPCIWAIMMFYYKLRCWCYMRKFWKKNVVCPNCQDIILSEIDAINHDNCDSNQCPHCKEISYSNKDLLKHVRKCEKREEVFDRTREVLQWESHGFKCKYDAAKVYRKKKFNVVWVCLFVLIFLSSFTPSIASRHGCSTFRHCMDQEKMRLSVNNNHAPGKDAGSDWEFVKSTEGPKQVTNGNELLKATETIIEAMKTLKNDMNKKIDFSYNAIIDNVAVMLKNAEAKLQEAIDTKILTDKCNSIIRDVNMNVYLPNSLGHGNFEQIRVHVDDEFKMFELGGAIQQININNRDLQPALSVGSDGVSLYGRDYQHAIGGSGGHNKFATGGGTNLDINGKYDSEDTLGSQYDGLLDRMRSKRSVNQMQKDEIKMEEVAAKLKDDRMEMDYNRSLSKTSPFEMLMHKRKVKLIRDERHEITEYQLSKHEPLKSRKPGKDLHTKWFDFHDSSEGVCEVNCLHEPGTCECVGRDVPKSGKYRLPWTTLMTNDIHFVMNPLSFKFASTTVDRSDYDNLYLKTSISGAIDLHEGSHVTWTLENEKSNMKPTLSIVIPKISQIYQTSFLYYTCEREIDTEVKGLCTGGCRDYCGGRVCLGSRIWKWENCRKITCNPSWCWATNDGCCCCGSNVVCPANGNIGSVWNMEYLRTEFLLCVFYNDRLQNCRLVDSTQTLEFGQFSVGITKVSATDKKLSKTVLAVHEPVVGTKGQKASMWTSPTDLYLEPPVCSGSQQCNHGYIGDVQVEEISCLPKLGKFCKEELSELHASNCTNKVYISHANTDMHMTCHSFNHHTCTHENSVKKLTFSDHLHQTEKMSDHFYIKKLSMDFKEQSMLIYPLPKENAGTISYEIQGQGIMVPKKDKKPVIENVLFSSCNGCFLCKSGFTCSVSLDLTLPDSSLITFKSETDLVDFNLNPVALQKGNNVITLWGVAYGKSESLAGCIHFGTECIKKFKAKMNVDEPVGQFIPNFNTITGGGTDPVGKCAGWSWFSCAISSVEKFFADMWSGIWKYLVIVVCILLLCIIFMFMPQLFLLIKACCNIFPRKRNGRIVVKGKHVNDVYRDLSRKKEKYNKHKKTDAEDYELQELMIQNDDIDFVTP